MGARSSVILRTAPDQDLHWPIGRDGTLASWELREAETVPFDALVTRPLHASS